MRWTSALSRSIDPERAARETAEGVLAGLEGETPDLLLAFASAEHVPRLERLRASLARAMPDALLVGCSGGSVIGGGHEVEEGAAFALGAASLPGVQLDALHLGAEAEGDAQLDPDWWRERFGASDPDEPQLLLLADPFSVDLEPAAAALDRALPGAVKVGGLASGGDTPGSNALLLGDRIHRDGLVAVALSGNVAMDAVVAQGCRPVGNPMFVTRCRDNVLLEVDGRAPLAVLNEQFERASPEEKLLYQTALFVGVEMQADQTVYQGGDFLIRNLIGGDPESGALSVAAPLHETEVVQFHLRDAAAAAADLEERLSAYRADTPVAGAVLFSCLGRGRGLYGEPDHDSRAFQDLVAEVPLTGFFCNGEIGPVQGRTFLHGYTSAFGIFRPRYAQPDGRA